jgi:phosphate transport system substrate-binding protein
VAIARHRVALWLVFAAFLVATHPTYAQRARDYVSIVTDATLYPLAATAVEAFGASTRFKYPQIETADASVGFALFCAGKSLDQPDIILSIRPITADERLRCVGNDVAEPADIALGFIAVVLVEATAATVIQPTAKELFLAVAAKVPDSRRPDAAVAAINPLAAPMIQNVSSTWNDLGPKMPARPIHMFLGPPVGAARDLFDDLVLLPGCRALPTLEAVDRLQFRRMCGGTRQDGRIDENHRTEAELSAALSDDTQAIALANFDFLDRNSATLRAVKLDGVVPSAASINDGSHPAARPVHLYIKRDNITLVPGLRDFVDEIAGTNAAGADGYLVKVGLVPLAAKTKAENRTVMRDVMDPEPKLQRASSPALEEARAAEKARAQEAATSATAPPTVTPNCGRTNVIAPMVMNRSTRIDTRRAAYWVPAPTRSCSTARAAPSAK